MLEPRTEDRVQALSALHAADISGNESAQSATIAIVSITVAYVSITSIVLRTLTSVPIAIFCWLALPVIFLQTYQMLLAAAVTRRAASAKLIEDRLFGHACLAPLARTAIGTAGSDSVLNIADICSRLREEKKQGKQRLLTAMRLGVASLSYVGFYLIGIGFTAYDTRETWQRYDSGWPVWAVISGVTYSVLWMVLLAVAVYYFIFRPEGDKPI